MAAPLPLEGPGSVERPSRSWCEHHSDPQCLFVPRPSLAISNSPSKLTEQEITQGAAMADDGDDVDDADDADDDDADEEDDEEDDEEGDPVHA